MNKYLIFLLMVWWSCGSDRGIKDEILEPVVLVVPIETEQITPQIEKIVPLETKDESVFGQFYDLRINDNGYYILDHIFTRNIYYFDMNGLFKNKLGTGKGPSEVLHTYSMYLDNKAREVYVYDAGNNRISVFDFGLNHLRTIHINNKIAYHHFSRIHNNKWLVQANYRNYPLNDTTALYVLLDSDFQKIDQKYIPFNLHFKSVTTMDPVSTNSQNQVLFSGIFDNNLYAIDDQDKLQIKYKVDFGEYNLTERELQTDDNTTITKLWKEGRRKTYIDRVSETDQYVGFAYLFKEDWEFSIFSKKTGIVLDSESIKNDDFIPGIFVHLTDDYFVLVAEPSSIIEYINRSEKTRNRFKDLDIKEGDNPVLVYYRLDEVL